MKRRKRAIFPSACFTRVFRQRRGTLLLAIRAPQGAAMMGRSLSVRCRKGLARDVFVLQPHTASLLVTLPVHVILRTDGPFGHAGRANKIQWPDWFRFNSYPSFIEGIQNDKKPITTATTMTTKQNNSCHTLHQAIFLLFFSLERR